MECEENMINKIRESIIYFKENDKKDDNVTFTEPYKSKFCTAFDSEDYYSLLWELPKNKNINCNNIDNKECLCEGKSYCCYDFEFKYQEEEIILRIKAEKEVYRKGQYIQNILIYRLLFKKKINHYMKKIWEKWDE